MKSHAQRGINEDGLMLQLVGEIKTIVDSLGNRLEDNKIVIRHAILRIFYVLVTQLGADSIIPHMMKFLSDEY